MKTNNDCGYPCAVCGATENIIAGRWIFYCPKHKRNDWEHTYENEIKPDLQSGNMDYINNDGELADMVLNNF